MKIYRNLLLLTAVFILSANFVSAQEFTFSGFDYLHQYGFLDHYDIVKISFKDNSVKIFDDGWPEEKDEFFFNEVFIDRSEEGRDYMTLRNIGGVIIEIQEDKVSIYEYNYETRKYEPAYEYYVEEGTRLNDIVAVFKNEDTFMFSAGLAKMGSLELSRLKDNAIIVSFSLNQIYNGNLMYDIQSVKVGTLTQTGERVVYGEIKSTDDEEKYYITANKALFGNFIYNDVKDLDFEKFYRKAVEKSGATTASTGVASSTATTSGSTAASASFDWRSRISEILRTGSHAFTENGRVTDRVKGGTFVTNANKGLMMYQWAEGAIYIGEVENGKSSGEGIFIPADGDYYQDIAGWTFFGGVYKNGVPVHGMAYDRNGNYYERAIFMNGNVAERVKDDAPSLRFQVIKYENDDPKSRDFYIGKTTDGQRRGIGMMVWKNNDIWIGKWSADKQLGNGIYISNDGTYTIGKWSNGEFVQEL